MPAGRDFLDSAGKIGRPTRGPRNRAAFSADSPSRSLSLASRDQKLTRKLVCEVRADDYLVIDTSQIINDQKIRVSKTVAIKLARWILKQYPEDKNARPESQSPTGNTQETDMAGTSEGDRRIPSKPTETE